MMNIKGVRANLLSQGMKVLSSYIFEMSFFDFLKISY